MPKAIREGAEIYYETRGSGPPLVLIEGLGYGLWMWRGQSPALEDRFRLILIDNRGVGRSTPLTAPYSMDRFARDALAVCDAEGIRRAAILGASMGGFSALACAAIAPARLTALGLAGTSPGGPEARPMPPETWAEVTRTVPGEPEMDRLRRNMSIALTPSFPRERADELSAILTDRIASPTDPGQWMFQALSARDFDARETDSRLPVPTLITTGTADRVVPWTNSLLLFKLIPRASLALFRGQNHLHLMERSQEFNRVTQRFLDSVSTGTHSPSIEEVP